SGVRTGEPNGRGWSMAVSGLRAWATRSPLTDPRSVFGSLVFHAVLVLAVSAAALSAPLRTEPEGPQVLRGELDPVGNPALRGEGGGSPGEINADRLSEALEAVVPVPTGPSSAPAAPAEALLSEILPNPSTAHEAVRQALPGPSTTVPGLSPSHGSGGGGGSGG